MSNTIESCLEVYNPRAVLFNLFAGVEQLEKF